MRKNKTLRKRIFTKEDDDVKEKDLKAAIRRL